MANEKSPAMIGDLCEWGIMEIFLVLSFCGRTISGKYVVDFHDALIEKASKNLLISESKRSFSNQDLKKGMLFCTSTAVEKKRVIWTTESSQNRVRIIAETQQLKEAAASGIRDLVCRNYQVSQRESNKYCIHVQSQVRK